MALGKLHFPCCIIPQFFTTYGQTWGPWCSLCSCLRSSLWMLPIASQGLLFRVANRGRVHLCCPGSLWFPHPLLSIYKSLLPFFAVLHRHLYVLLRICLLLFICCLVAKSCLTLLRPHGLEPATFLCPWNFPGKNTGVGSHFLPRDIADPGTEPASPAWQPDSLPLSHQGSPGS